MPDEPADVTDGYHAAISNLLDEVTRDASVSPELHDAAGAAQISAGVVEEREAVITTSGASQPAFLLQEKRNAETQRDQAVIQALKASASTTNVDIAIRARDLLNSLPNFLSAQHDLSSVRASLDMVVLSAKKSAAPQLKVRK